MGILNKKRKPKMVYEDQLVAGQRLTRLAYTDQLPEMLRKERTVSIADLPEGTQVTTSGGTVGRITGYKKGGLVQIRLNNGQTDWLHTSAEVTIQ